MSFRRLRGELQGPGGFRAQGTWQLFRCLLVVVRSLDLLGVSDDPPLPRQFSPLLFGFSHWDINKPKDAILIGVKSR